MSSSSRLSSLASQLAGLLSSRDVDVDGGGGDGDGEQELAVMVLMEVAQMLAVAQPHDLSQSTALSLAQSLSTLVTPSSSSSSGSDLAVSFALASLLNMFDHVMAGLGGGGGALFLNPFGGGVSHSPSSPLLCIYAKLIPSLLNILANPALYLDSTDQTLQLLNKLITSSGTKGPSTTSSSSSPPPPPPSPPPLLSLDSLFHLNPISTSLLQYLDFYSIHSQRTLLAIAANATQGLALRSRKPPTMQSPPTSSSRTSTTATTRNQSSSLSTSSPSSPPAVILNDLKLALPTLQRLAIDPAHHSMDTRICHSAIECLLNMVQWAAAESSSTIATTTTTTTTSTTSSKSRKKSSSASKKSTSASPPTQTNTDLIVELLQGSNLLEMVMMRLSQSMQSSSTSSTSSTASSFSSLDPFVFTHLIRLVACICKSSSVLSMQLLGGGGAKNSSSSTDLLNLVASLLTGGIYSPTLGKANEGGGVGYVGMGLLGLAPGQRDKIRNATIHAAAVSATDVLEDVLALAAACLPPIPPSLFSRRRNSSINASATSTLTPITTAAVGSTDLLKQQQSSSSSLSCTSSSSSSSSSSLQASTPKSPLPDSQLIIRYLTTISPLAVDVFMASAARPATRHCAIECLVKSIHLADSLLLGVDKGGSEDDTTMMNHTAVKQVLNALVSSDCGGVARVVAVLVDPLSAYITPSPSTSSSSAQQTPPVTTHIPGTAIPLVAGGIYLVQTLLRLIPGPAARWFRREGILTSSSSNPTTTTTTSGGGGGVGGLYAFARITRPFTSTSSTSSSSTMGTVVEGSGLDPMMDPGFQRQLAMLQQILGRAIPTSSAGAAPSSTSTASSRGGGRLGSRRRLHRRRRRPDDDDDDDEDEEEEVDEDEMDGMNLLFDEGEVDDEDVDIEAMEEDGAMTTKGQAAASCSSSSAAGGGSSSSSGGDADSTRAIKSASSEMSMASETENASPAIASSSTAPPAVSVPSTMRSSAMYMDRASSSTSTTASSSRLPPPPAASTSSPHIRALDGEMYPDHELLEWCRLTCIDAVAALETAKQRPPITSAFDASIKADSVEEEDAGVDVVEALRPLVARLKGDNDGAVAGDMFVDTSASVDKDDSFLLQTLHAVALLVAYGQTQSSSYNGGGGGAFTTGGLLDSSFATPTSSSLPTGFPTTHSSIGSSSSITGHELIESGLIPGLVTFLTTPGIPDYVIPLKEEDVAAATVMVAAPVALPVYAGFQKKVMPHREAKGKQKLGAAAKTTAVTTISSSKQKAVVAIPATATASTPVSKFKSSVKARFKAFAHVFLNCPSPTAAAAATTTTTQLLFVHGAFKILVQRLEQVLSRLERFEVISAIPPPSTAPAAAAPTGLEALFGGGAQDFSLASLFAAALGAAQPSSQPASSAIAASPAYQLSRQIRLKLVPHDPASVSRAYAAGVHVSVHAVATFKQIEEFLKTRVLIGSGGGSSSSSSGGGGISIGGGGSSSAASTASNLPPAPPVSLSTSTATDAATASAAGSSSTATAATMDVDTTMAQASSRLAATAKSKNDEDLEMSDAADASIEKNDDADENMMDHDEDEDDDEDEEEGMDEDEHDHEHDHDDDDDDEEDEGDYDDEEDGEFSHHDHDEDEDFGANVNVSDILIQAEEQLRRGRRSSIHSDSSAASSSAANALAAAVATSAAPPSTTSTSRLSSSSRSNNVTDIANVLEVDAISSSSSSTTAATNTALATSAASSSTSTAPPPPLPPSSRSYAAAVSKSEFTVEFSLGSVPISPDTTIFAAAYKNEQQLNHTGNAAAQYIWSQVYTVTYKKVEKVDKVSEKLDKKRQLSLSPQRHHKQQPQPTSNSSTLASVSSASTPSSSSSITFPSSSAVLPLRDASLGLPFSIAPPAGVDASSDTDQVLLLLRLLFRINSKWAEIYTQDDALIYFEEGAVASANGNSSSAAVVARAAGPSSLPPPPPLITTTSTISQASKLSSDISTISPLLFQSNKLTAKLTKQLDEPLIVASRALPPWCAMIAREFSFLLPFDARHIFLQSTSFGYSRSLVRWQQDAPGGNSAGGGGGGGGGDGLRMGRIQRQKVRLDRKRLVESMVKVMELYGTSQSLLEIEYFDEVGTGLGPTLEFYSNVCRELRRKGGIQFNNAEDLVKLWQEDSTRSISLAVTDASGAQKNVGTSSKEKEAKEDVSMSEADEEDVDAVEKRKKKADATADVAGATAEYIYSPLGLFPSPINKASKHSTSTKHCLQIFKSLGTFVGKALLDSRIIDLPLNPIFFKLAFGEFGSLDPKNEVPSTLLVSPGKRAAAQLYALKLVDPQMHHSLLHLIQYLEQKKQIIRQHSSVSSSSSLSTLISQIKVKDALIQDLCLDFTLPGYPQVELVANGASREVTMENLEEYVMLVLDMVVGSGVARQVKYFRRGFDKVFPLTDLKTFTSLELGIMFGSEQDEDWSYEVIAESIKADHGYNAESKTTLNLAKMMAEFNKDKRRDFLQFITGSPRLPIGGFKSLQPQLTVVRKPVDSGKKPDDYLPSVMTCVNYLKVPEYSSLEVMRRRFEMAIAEGQGAFHLS